MYLTGFADEAASNIEDQIRATKELGWKPRMDFEGLVDSMVDADLELVESEIETGGRRGPRLKTPT